MLKQHFDIIIFDTSPVGLLHDATLVANYADHTILVTRQHATSRQKVRHSVGLMDRSEAPILGVVFNGVKNIGAASSCGAYGSEYSYSKDADKYKKHYEAK